MLYGAPRNLWRLLRNLAGGAVTAALFWSPAAASSVTQEDWTARFSEPTNRYGHAIMGDLPEWGRLCLSGPPGRACVTLPFTSVFEDIAPRLADLDGDGRLEAVVVESSFAGGAALVIYKLGDGMLERVATPPIGTRNRWLAPVAIADLDGDGQVELAYIDRPHLAKRLRIWRYTAGKLMHLTDAPGLTNHRIGEPFISGGLRVCNGRPEMILADASWSRVVAVSFEDGQTSQRDLSAFSPANMDRALACE